MSKLKILIWNINGRSSYNSAYAIPSFIASEIISIQEPTDVIILTEFVIAPGWCHLKAVLEDNGYTLFASYISSQNGILIAIRKNIEGLDIKSAIMSTEMNTKNEKPNFLQVKVDYNKELLTIIGTRIRIKDIKRKDFQSDTAHFQAIKKEYLERKSQVEALLDHIVNEKSVLIGGDFNNLKIRGNEYKKHSEVKEEYHYNNKGEELVSYDTYNYHILKDAVEGCGLCLHTPQGDVFSWGGYIKDDHIIASDNITVSNEKYIWDFVNEKNGYGKLNANNNLSKLIGQPDHAILMAEISIG